MKYYVTAFEIVEKLRIFETKLKEGKAENRLFDELNISESIYKDWQKKYGKYLSLPEHHDASSLNEYFSEEDCDLDDFINYVDSLGKLGKHLISRWADVEQFLEDNGKSDNRAYIKNQLNKLEENNGLLILPEGLTFIDLLLIYSSSKWRSIKYFKFQNEDIFLDEKKYKTVKNKFECIFDSRTPQHMLALDHLINKYRSYKNDNDISNYHESGFYHDIFFDNDDEKTKLNSGRIVYSDTL